MSALLVKIGQLAIFLICAQTLVHFRPKDSYEKYIKLLVSMMLLILLVEPFMDLLGKDNKGEFMERVRVYEHKLQDILITPRLETEQIEVILQNIIRQKVQEGSVYVQEQVESVAGMIEEEKQVIGKEGLEAEEITVQVKVEGVQEVRIGVEDGKSANSH